MGISYSSYALIGVIVPVAHLFKTVMVERCSHPDKEGQKFCPHCGASTKLMERTHGDDFFELWDLTGERIDPGYVWVRADENHPKGSHFLYYGLGVYSDRDDGYRKHGRDLKGNPIHSDQIIQHIREQLQGPGLAKFNLWSDEVEKSFALYSLTTGH